MPSHGELSMLGIGRGVIVRVIGNGICRRREPPILSLRLIGEVMTDIPGALSPPNRVLMGPGPSDVPPSVLAAMARPTVGHLDPYYLQVMDELQGMLKQVFRTRHDMTFAVSGTGSAGQEATVVNLVEPGDAVVVCVNGIIESRTSGWRGFVAT